MTDIELLYEYHVTVEIPDTLHADFQMFCIKNKWKPLIIANLVPDGKHTRQVSTHVMMSYSGICFGSNTGWHKTLLDICRKLEDHYLSGVVVRMKVERTPFLFQTGDYPGRYFESHFKMIVPSSIKRVGDLRVGVSRNTLKPLKAGDRDICLGTIRKYSNYFDFQKYSEQQKLLLTKAGYELITEPEEVEFCILDSNPSLDDDWLNLA